MSALRWGALAALVLGIYVAFGFYEPAPPLVEQLAARRAAVAAELSAGLSATPGLPSATPTMIVTGVPTVTVTPTPSSTDVIVSPTGVAATATDAPSVTPTPTSIDVVDGTDTPVPTSTATPTTVILTFTPTASPTETPTVPPDVPPLTDDIDAVGQAATARIGAATGGRVSSPDGRVTVDFPAGAISEDLDVSITRREPLSYDPPSPNYPLASVWQFDASAADRGGAAVHQFDADVTFTIHFSDRELGGLDPATLQFWTLDETAGTWAGLPSRVNADERIMIVQANHFSIDGATADRLVDNAPLLDGKNTNLHTGSASLDIPISVPPGRGGLAPDLRLTYDSGRIGEMKQYTDVSSWVGMGWELSTGSISFDPPITAGCTSGNVYCSQGPHRITLDLGGFGGEMFRDGGAWDAYTLGGSWHVGTNPYLRVEHNCANIDCPFVVTDQHGTKYTFGASDQSKRWLCTGSSTCVQRQYYRFDLETIEDTLANTVDFTYWQQFKWTQCDVYNHGCTPTYVISAYPTVIDYNGGQMRVEFNREYDTGGCIVDVTTGQTVGCLEARGDVVGDFSYQQQCNPWFISYIAPKARESSRLNSIDVKVKDAGGTYQRVRKYQFAYTTEGGDLHNSYPDCGPPEAGVIKLDSIDIRDRNDALTLSHMTFAYTDETFSYKTAIGTSLWTFTRPHLTHAENGFGGAIDFTYATKEKTGTTVDHWTRPVVTSETHSAGLGEPAVATTFTYSNGPDEYPWDNPYRDLMSPYPDYFGAGYRGFQSVTETDALGNSTGHTFFTTNVGGGWYDEVRSGREISSVVRDGAGNAWQSASTDWVVRPVAAADSGYNYCSNPCNPPFGGPTSTPTTTPTASPVPPQAQQTVMHANFVYAASQTTTQRNGQQTKTVYTYDDGCPATPCYGLLTRVDDVGDPNVTPHSAEVWTNSAWNKDTTAWVFTKQYDEKVDPNNGNALLSRTNFYYDGANTRNPSPLPSPVRGLLTAQSTQLNLSPGDYSATYSIYDQWGNITAQSNPTSLRPEDQTPPGSPNFGWLPAGVATSGTTYESTYHLYPATTTNALGQTTAYTTYDYIIGKPTRIDDPTGLITSIRYDTFGRIMSSWDNSGMTSSSGPKYRFTYDWGALPNRTLVEQKSSGPFNSGTYRSNVSCMDGFGREVQSLTNYAGTSMSSVRTDYDARSNKAVVTTAFASGTSTSCPATPAAVSGYDRTAYEYDPLGNASVTTYLKAGETTGPHTASISNGTTTTSIDEMYRRTVTKQDVNGRTTTVTEPLKYVTMRPNGMASTYSSFTASPAGAHNLNIDETTFGDDAATQLDRLGSGKETAVYDGAGLAGGMVSAVVFHFRWKEADSPENPANGVWPVFRQNSTDTRGPSYHRTNADGWGDAYWTMPVNPRTGAAWTLAEINGNLEFGFEVNGATAHPYITQSWLEVDLQTEASAQTTYSYDLLGRLVSVKDAAGSTDATRNLSSITYDLAGRKTAMHDPDMGDWTYAYDAAGNLKTQTDARGITTTLSYDALQRLTDKSYSGIMQTAVHFDYDAYPDATLCPQGNTAKGRPVKMTDGGGAGGAEYHCYDKRGQEVTTRRVVDNTNYDISRTFDHLGQIATLTYPDGEVVSYAETAQGDVYGATAGTTALLSATVRKPWGAPSSLTLGNTLVTSFDYDTRGRVSHIQTGSSVQNLTYTYDDASNITAIADAGQSPETLTYSYDQLNRLTGMKSGATTLASYTYTQVGNLGYKSDESSPGYLITYPAPGPNSVRPHAAQSVFGGAFSFAYDASGNMTSSLASGTNLSTFGYDGDNHLVSRTGAGGNYTYTYDGNGTLVKRTDTSTGAWTVYIGGIYEITNTGTITKYYSALGRTVAMRRAGALYWLLADHLGSNSVVTDGVGLVVGSIKYGPYGGTRSTTGTLVTDKLFTGQQQEAGDPLGLYNYGARFYSSKLGRFLSVDPVQGVATEPQTFNAFSYAMNNPLKYHDPTGKCVPGVNCPSDKRDDDIEAQRSHDEREVEYPAPPARAEVVCDAEGHCVDTEELRNALEVLYFVGVTLVAVPVADQLTDWIDSTDVDDEDVFPEVAPGEPIAQPLPSPAESLGLPLHPTLQQAKQNRHIRGSANFKEGRSELEADPNELLRAAGTGQQAGNNVVGEAGSHERIEYGRVIGIYVDPQTGERTPTTVGIIHYDSRGQAHVVPARPAPNESSQ